MYLRQAEITAILIVAVLGVADGLLIFVKAQAIDWASYAPGILAAFVAMAVGLTYRALDRSEGIALGAVATGLFVLFTIAASILNYLLFPFAAPTIDAVLTRIDDIFGYHWPDFVAMVGTMPWLGSLLARVYLSSLPQLVLVIILLGFMEKPVALHRFLLTGMLGAALSISFWWLAPSFGPSTMYDIPEDLADRIDLVVRNDYGAELQRLAIEGSALITAKDTLGVIAFPSFHTVMALMAVWFTWSTPLRLPFLAVNVLMMPAILAHGGHHLVDLAGGVVVFFMALGIARVLVPGAPEQRRIASRVV
ncbi:phosphatase PAP2 family protein [Mesorhizobium sp. YIM 152430]|uniref:phosphatase PAP2 family protein n=1 Tax=Mesorhizobium sp. YIM 152430 TaxID=3031761 RepID=UPI0023DC8F48|nr:phosphatase PAP2 family protein [Mesorhizobium sp. YIM 152430]MDF1600134.1 phosphatase PAP2 family protein [Mesorhizobium sp. YIM 152430]